MIVGFVILLVIVQKLSSISQYLLVFSTYFVKRIGLHFCSGRANRLSVAVYKFLSVNLLCYNRPLYSVSDMA